MEKSTNEKSGTSDDLDESRDFESILQVDVPQGREGKHKQIVTKLLENLSRVPVGSALKVPLSRLSDSKENVRAALSRAARQQNIALTTSSNDEFLYIWKTDDGA